MNILSGNNAAGDIVRLARTDTMHISGKVHAHKEALDPQVEGQSFGSLVTDALTATSNMEQDSNALAQQFIIDPESVDVHDVTIAMGKANLAVSMTKSVTDAALRAYREIINIR
jgi:flagellar hook-basal body complex protein FliE